MARRRLSQDELDKVVRLRQAGASWLKIQNETGIHRRTAKRVYENWERSQSVQELKEARREVAAEEFRAHLESLIRMASSLVTNLSVPPSLTDMEKNSEQFFSWLWQQDLLQRSISPETQVIYTMGDKQGFYIGDTQSYRREKELLFESLKVHTRGEVRWEEILDNRWKEARDNCAKIVPKLQKETSEVVTNYLNQERKADFLRSIKEGSREDNPAKRIAEVVLRQIWRDILQDNLDEKGLWFETESGHIGAPQDIDIIVKSRDEKVFTFVGNANKSLADNVTRICNLAGDNLRKGDMVRWLYREVGKLKRASGELRETLNPVRLRPMILRTRCNLCPA
jgi:hypothetical protein